MCSSIYSIFRARMALIGEAPGFLEVYSDGSVRRLIPEVVVSTDNQSSKNYKFKDVAIDPKKPVTGRLFLPNVIGNHVAKLPILVYFHGGGFCIGSTTWMGYHHFLGGLAVASNCVILSIDYRLAPENRLPAAYEDCYSSLEWLAHQASCFEPWLQNADLSRVFLAGDSAGGNIVHHVALKTMKTNISNLTIKGLMLIHPYFGSEKRTEKEKAEGVEGFVEMNDMFWRLSIPKGSNLDYFGCNYENNTQEMSKEEWSKFPNVVVFVAGLDFLKERGELYVNFLQQKWVKVVKLIEAVDESHVFHVFRPESEPTRLLQMQMTEFMNTFN
ncbi:probable carboxylesterase 17 [Cucurbita maxima]|uniref:Probable carboxylesterase 17 n=1 Tax=Cucurbita maxima TaxID=3661 RepID=A0A6J1IMT6_CUCMA|nr:probable carboxylesterase 17 [Cucurbita maxima]